MQAWVGEIPVSAVGQGGSTGQQSGADRLTRSWGENDAAHIDSMLVEGVVRPKHGHHEQQSELVLVEESWGRERA